MNPSESREGKPVLASDFASKRDRVKFDFWYARFRSRGDDHETATNKAFAHGDNQEGYTGIFTGTDSVAMCALPPDEWHLWGGHKADSVRKHVVVKDLETGTEVICEHNDTMPAYVDIDNGCSIDLNPGALKAFGWTSPVKKRVTWRWLEAAPWHKKPAQAEAPKAPVPAITLPLPVVAPQPPASAPQAPVTAPQTSEPQKPAPATTATPEKPTGDEDESAA